MAAPNSQIGLTSTEAAARLRSGGPNAIEQVKKRSASAVLARQFASPLIYLLLVALALDAAVWMNQGRHGWPLEPIAIAAILVVNALLGAIQERRAESAIDHLKSLSAPSAWAYRDGVLVRLAARDLVEGDVVRIDEGSRIPADGIVVHGHGTADESILTGESLPLDKNPDDEVYAGTLFVHGTARVRIERTGSRSSLGRIAGLLGQVSAGQTPLEKKLAAFGNTVARWILVIAAILVAGGLMMEGPSSALHLILFAVALAVAAVPESLPAVLTVCLSTGVEKMAKRKAVVRRLSAVEALGSVTVIATDKTGTLTENRIRVAALDAPNEDLALRIMVIANECDPDSTAGDPLDRALLDYALQRGVDVEGLLGELTRHASRPFDSRRKSMRVTVHEGGRLVSYLKGAPEVLLDRCAISAEQRRFWEERVELAAGEGRRVLALGVREEAGDKTLTFAGLVCLADPPRVEVRDAIDAARRAGIRVVMVTGDHPATAMAICRAVGIPSAGFFTHDDFPSEGPLPVRPDVNVYARVTPEDKLRLVSTLQEQGEIVAMTGDGVNDAPALKKAHLAIAMGGRGSDVAREVSDLVLLDDNFATIVAAIEEGRGIYENIRKFVRFLFSTDVALIMLVFAATLGSYVEDLRGPAGSLLLPLTALMLLWINVISDGAPAVALGLDGNVGMLDRPPRDPDEPLLDSASVRFIVATGLFKAGAGIALLVLVPVLAGSRELARTVLFHFESLAQLSFAYPSRGPNTGRRPNVILACSIAASVAAQGVLAFWPPARRLFQLEPLDPRSIAVTLAGVVVAAGMAEWLMRSILSNSRVTAARDAKR